MGLLCSSAHYAKLLTHFASSFCKEDAGIHFWGYILHSSSIFGLHLFTLWYGTSAIHSHKGPVWSEQKAIGMVRQSIENQRNENELEGVTGMVPKLTVS